MKNICKVALKAVQSKRIMYASGYRGLPVRAPSTGITIEGYHYDPYEIIPASVIQIADSENIDKLFAMIDQDKLISHLRNYPDPGQMSLPGIDNPHDRNVVDRQDVVDRQRRENARSFTPLDTITTRGSNSSHKPYYEAMYDWMVNYFKDWYENLDSDQEVQAKSFGRRIKIAGEMNPYLRKKHGSYEHNAEAIEEGIRVFDSLVDDAPPIEQDTIVYRGIPDLKSILAPGATTIKKGEIVDNGQYMSSTIDPRVSVGNFMSSYNSSSLLMRIVLPKGTRVAPVSAYNMVEDHTTKKSYVDGNGPNEMELTLPRDSKLRIVSEPHFEEFKDGNSTRTINVADFELVPQPTPKESPQLPHREIERWHTGGRQNFDDHYDYDEERESDPWEDYDYENQKNDKMDDMKTILREYEENPAHDEEALIEVNDLVHDLYSVDHTDYDSPDEYEEEMQGLINKAKKIIKEAPEHTEELWEQFNPVDKEHHIQESLAHIDRIIDDYKNAHPDLSNPLILSYLNKLNDVREKIANWRNLDLAEHFTYPDEFIDDLSKKSVEAGNAAEIGHALYQEQVSGKPPLYAGAFNSLNLLKGWMIAKKKFDQKLSRIRETNSEVSDKLQVLWDKATHDLPPGYETDQLIGKINNKTTAISNGVSPEADYYNAPSLASLERNVNQNVMLYRAVKENIARVESSGVFQGKNPGQEYISTYAKKLYHFNRYLSDYIKKQESKGEEISPQVDALRKLWNLANKETDPDYSTAYFLDDMVKFARYLKDGQLTNYNVGSLEDLKKRVNSKVISEGSPEAKLQARKENFDYDYKKAMEKYKNSYYYNEKNANVHEKFKDYVKSKGIDDIKDLDKLSPEVQEQVFTQANALIDNINKFANGHYLKDTKEDIWPHPAEEPKPISRRAQELLEYKKKKADLLKEFGTKMFEYGGMPHYDSDAHSKLNEYVNNALENYPDGKEQLAHLGTAVSHAEDLIDNEHDAKSNLDLSLEDIKNPSIEFLSHEGLKDLYEQKNKEFNEAIDKYHGVPGYNAYTHSGYTNDFYMNKQPYEIVNKFMKGTPKEKQDILNNFDNVINNVKELTESLSQPAKPSEIMKHKIYQSAFPDQVNDINHGISQYENMENPDPKALVPIYRKFNDLVDNWYHESKPEDVNFHKAELGNLKNDLDTLITYHIKPPEKEKTIDWEKLAAPINTEGWDIELGSPGTGILKDKVAEWIAQKRDKPPVVRETVSEPVNPPDVHEMSAVSDLNENFPEQVKIFMDHMDTYNNHPDYDEKKQKAFQSLHQGVANNWKKNKDPVKTEKELGILTALSGAAIKSPESKEKLHDQLNITGRINYERIRRRVFYAASGEIFDFTPHDYVLHPDFAKGSEYYDKMYNFQVNHYGDFVKSLSPTEQEALMPGKPDPIKIATMNSYLNGRANYIPEYANHVKKGVGVMDGIINSSPPLTHDLIVYRGLGRIKPEEAPGKGSLLYSPGFQSTSLNERIARHAFSYHDAVARIHIPAGTKLGPLTAHQIRHFKVDKNDKRFKMMEQELVLGRGHHMLVTHPIEYNPKTQTHTLNVKLLPQGPAPMSEPGSPVERQHQWIVKRPHESSVVI